MRNRLVFTLFGIVLCCAILSCSLQAALPNNGTEAITLNYSAVTLSPAPSGGFASIKFADFNKDSNLDFTACSDSSSSPGLHVFLGNGGTIFTESATGLSSSGGGGGGCEIGDVNEDTYPEIIYSQQSWYGGSGIDIYKGTVAGGGTMSWSLLNSPFTSSSNDVKVIDVNKDGHLDIVYSTSSGVKVKLGDGSGTSWTSANSGLPTDKEYTGIAVGDLNGDTYPDIAAGNYVNYCLRVWLQNRSGAPSISWDDGYTGTDLVTSWQGAECPIISDFNKDTKNDISCTYGGNVASPYGIRVFLGNNCNGAKSGWWKSASTNLPESSSRWYFGLSAVDMDKDGNLDIIAGSGNNGGSNEIEIWRGNGGAGGMSWTKGSTNLPTDKGPDNYDVDVGDINSDGNPDIAVTSTGGIEIWKNTYGVIEYGIPLAFIGFVSLVIIITCLRVRRK